MQFKHPEILWGLIAIIIPIIIHLFQLRKFKKVPFTNVAFLKEVTLQTRKSSQLKKWLVLLSRLLAISAVVIAFAQPYIANRDINTTTRETVIYLDNSFSMQLGGAKGILLNRAVQELINEVPESEEVTVYTNNKTFPKNTIKSIQNDLLQLEYSTTQLDIDELILKGSQLFEKDVPSVKTLVIISDFQQKKQITPVAANNDIELNAIKLVPLKKINFAIDSIYISKVTPTAIELRSQISTSDLFTGNHPISLYNSGNLIAKASAEFNNTTNTTIDFSIPVNETIEGMIGLEDEALEYDNSLYFNITNREKINVLAINQTNDDFLSRIYTEDEFNFTSTSYNNIDFSLIEEQNLIIVNELTAIPNALATALSVFSENGGKIIVVPAKDLNTSNYNNFLNAFSLNLLDTVQTREKKITSIQFSHPVYQDVFDRQIRNFQYPKTNYHYLTNTPNYSSILNYEDGRSFLLEKNNMYLFSSPLTDDVSNFKSSPLIVPTFYSIAIKSLQLPKLYHTIGAFEKIDIKTSIGKDAILSVNNDDIKFIPLQQSFPNKVTLSFLEDPKISGKYIVKDENEILRDISFNYSRKESELNYIDPNEIGIPDSENSVASFFEKQRKNNNINALWKWFVTFALCFLMVELLLLKFLK